MSGFASMISLDGAPPDRLLLEKMAARLAFRGPDGTHIRTQPGAGFCFTFLRTGPAPQCPSQPCTLDGRTWLLGDIRLDGRDDVRRKLEQHGEELSPEATDEELVLRTWRRWGEEGIAELIGDYAFALWDAEARQLRCWRDLLGARPFFYAQAGGWLYFSNTLDAIRSAPDISDELDSDYISDFLLSEWSQDVVQSAFRDISRLPAGHRLRYARGTPQIRRYISLPIEEPLFLKREGEYVEEFGALLRQAVDERLPRGSAAILLSGGLDSTSIATIAVETAKKSNPRVDLRAFTIDCQPLFDDREAALATCAATHLNIPIEILRHSDWLPFEGWLNAQFITPEPSHEPYWAFYRNLYQRIAEHARVVFNGYGGDGVLTGQTWPYWVFLCREGRILKLARDFGGYFFLNGRFPPLRGGFRSWLSRFLLRNTGEKTPPWMAQRCADESRLRAASASDQNRHPWYPEAWSTFEHGYWATIQEREDSAWSGVPLESRAPLLDFRVQRFLLRVPPLPLCIEKQMLRRAMNNSLPDEIRLRRKTPLAGDPLGLQIAKGQWSPLPLPRPSTYITDFVDFARLSEVLARNSVSASWSEVRPLLLNYWLTGIEKGQGIK